jgi:uncharacterized protein YggU (UPF0235/DUF167 family)
VALIFAYMLIKVKFTPNSKKDEIVKKKDDEFEVKSERESGRGKSK